MQVLNDLINGIMTNIKCLLYLTSGRISTGINLNDDLLRIGLVRAHFTLGVRLEYCSKSHPDLL